VSRRGRRVGFLGEEGASPAHRLTAMVSFDLTLSTTTSLPPLGEPDDFITTFSASVTCRDEDGTPTEVGTALSYRIEASLAADAGESLFDVCDAHSAELHRVHALLYEPEGYEFREVLLRRFDIIESDCLVLDYVILDPKWRKLKLGLLVARRLVELLGGSCGLVVTDISPLLPSAYGYLEVPKAWIPRGDKKEARRKLRGYFRKLGFSRLGKTPYYALGTAHRMPSAEELLASGQVDG
jgi:hypothetical protein